MEKVISFTVCLKPNDYTSKILTPFHLRKELEKGYFIKDFKQEVIYKSIFKIVVLFTFICSSGTNPATQKNPAQ